MFLRMIGEYGPEFSRSLERRILKTLWKQEEMFETSIVVFSSECFSTLPKTFFFFFPTYLIVCTCFQLEPVFFLGFFFDKKNHENLEQ